jgi:plasmid stabilization system protein ParE
MISSLARFDPFATLPALSAGEVFPGLPYIGVYRIQDQDLEIVRIYHGAQDWP